MKLYIKSLITLGSIIAVVGSTIGGAYIFAKNNKDIQKYANKTQFSLINVLNKKSQESKVKESLVMNFIHPGNHVNSSIAKYLQNEKKVQYQGKKIEYNDFFNQYINKYGVEPTLITYAGSILFNNEYIIAIPPKEFAEYVAWFMVNVSWGPEIATLDTFEIVKGFKTEGDSVLLGSFNNPLKEKKKITFYPDAFFGAVPFFDNDLGAGRFLDSITYKANNILLSKLDVEKIVKAIKKLKKEDLEKSLENPEYISSYKNYKIRIIKEEGIIQDDWGFDHPGYAIYFDRYQNLIDDVVKKYPFIQKSKKGLYVDKNGDLQDGTHKGFDSKDRISMTFVLNAANTNFEGVGINFLKYLGAHEYQHLQTLQDAEDISEKPVLVGGVSANFSFGLEQLNNLDIVNLYLKARAPNLQIKTYSINNRKKDNPKQSKDDFSMFGRFIEKGKLEKFKDIYGSIKHKTNDDIEFAKTNLKRRAAVSLAQLEQSSELRGLSLWDLFIENAFDDKSGTISPGFMDDIFYFNSEGNFEKSDSNYIEKIMKDGDGHPIRFSADGDPIIWEIDKVIVHNKDGSPILPNITSNTDAQAISAMDLVNSFKNTIIKRTGVNGFFENANEEGRNDFMKERNLEYINEYYSDYTFSFPEVLSRDTTQISYVPSKKTLNNLPKFISNINEYNAGFEFFVDKKFTEKYLNKKISIQNFYPISHLNQTNTLLPKIENPSEKILSMFIGENSMININNQNLDTENYIGKTMILNNGFYKDRSLRKKTGGTLYDENGKSIVDENIKIKDFDGTLVKDRARAMWVYLLRAKGVGDRTISGIWRSKQKDAVYMWGYFEKKYANKIKYIEFTNILTKEKIYIPIKKNVDNLFYYTKQGDKLSKHSLEDEGYTSWMTDYNIIGDYTNSILKVDNSYSMKFVNNNKKEIQKTQIFTIGNKNIITENNKRILVTPSIISKNKNNQIIFKVNKQFNI